MTNPFFEKQADEIRDMWQARALREATGKLQRVLVVVFAKEYASALPVLLRVAIPGFDDIKRPFLTGYATILQSGRVVCDLHGNGDVIRKVEVYRTEDEFVKDMRDLADRLKLKDSDREEMFTVLRRWIAADYRINIFGRKSA